MKSILKLSVVSGIIQTNHTFIHYFSIMPTLQLTQSEANLLNELFSTIADLDLYENFDCEDSESDNAKLFDSLWDKVVKL